MTVQSTVLTGKVAVVTGSTRGIGRAIAQGLAEAGASVVVVSRQLEACEKTAAEIGLSGARTIAVPADVTKLDDLKHLVETTVREFGKVDILVNNAGGALTHRAEDVTEAEWDSVLGLDLKSVFFCSQAFGREMIRQNSGKIINVASIMGLVAQKLTVTYCAAKGGVIQMTRALALEWAQYNIQVNALCPGYVLTSMNEDFFMTNEKGRNAVLSKIPMGRMALTKDMAGSAVFLASEASNYMTGQTLTVDGGWTAQ